MASTKKIPEEKSDLPSEESAEGEKNSQEIDEEEELIKKHGWEKLDNDSDWLSGKFFVLLIGIVIVVALGGFGIGVFWREITSIMHLASQPTPTITIASTPLITKEPTIDPAQYSIEVLNGSGISGQASLIKKNLTTIGFTKIITGNAQGDHSNKTVVMFSPKISQAVKDMILKELSKIFTTIDTKQLSSNSSVDISITTGSDVKE